MDDQKLVTLMKLTNFESFYYVVSRLALNAILLTFSLNASCFSFVNLCCDLNIIPLYFINS